MNFFKSVFSEDPDPLDHRKTLSDSDDDDDHRYEEEQEPEPVAADEHNSEPDSNPPASGSTAWSFGGLMKTLASKSESVIQTYRRDLEEFSSGLKKETAVIREVAARAVKELPASLEVGASVAQESLESVGQAIDDFGNSVVKEAAEIIAQGKEAILAMDQDSDSSSDINSSNHHNNQLSSDRGLDSKRYSRFDVQLHAIQIDENTYCEEPENVDEYNNWKSGFSIDEHNDEIESLIEENGVMEVIYSKLIPSSVDHESFWTRYFYKVYKLKQAEEARAKLVKKAISGEEDDDLTWDFDDDEEKDGIAKKDDFAVNKGIDTGSHGVSNENEKFESSQVETSISGEKSFPSENNVESIVVESTKNEDEAINDGIQKLDADKTDEKSDDKLGSEGKTENGESCKDSDISIISTQPSFPEEDEIGWDEIEDIGSNNENKLATDESLTKLDMRKRLSVAEEDEDLTWDIEDDDDEPIKP